jgi:predicted GIY-YIG superfamily endonuclease
VYLVHFDRSYKHARHYIGFSTAPAERLAVHKNGNGARLLEVVSEAGIDYQIVRTWGGDRHRERRLKNQKNAKRLCPLCNPENWQNREKSKSLRFAP